MCCLEHTTSPHRVDDRVLEGTMGLTVCTHTHTTPLSQQLGRHNINRLVSAHPTSHLPSDHQPTHTHLVRGSDHSHTLCFIVLSASSCINLCDQSIEHLSRLTRILRLIARKLFVFASRFDRSNIAQSKRGQ